MHPRKPGISAFWQTVSMYPFAMRKLVILFPRMEKKIFPSTFNNASECFCSLGMNTQTGYTIANTNKKMHSLNILKLY